LDSTYSKFPQHQLAVIVFADDYLSKTLPLALTNYAHKGMLGMIDNYFFSALASRGFFDSAELIYEIHEDKDPDKWAIDSLLWGFSLNLEVFTFLLRTVSPTHYDRSIKTRLRPFTSFSERPWNPDAVLLLLHPGGSIRAKDLRDALQEGVSILHHFSFTYGRSLVRFREFPDYSLAWRRLIRKVIKFSDDLYVESVGYNEPYELMTPLFSFLDGLCRKNGVGWHYETWKLPKDYTKFVESHVYYWLQDLRSCGVNLCRYGETELAIFRRSRGWQSLRWSWGSQICESVARFRLIGFQYGPRPQDWSFDWDLEIEQCAGDFWEWVENPIIHVPGAWIDDDGHDDDEDDDSWDIKDNPSFYYYYAQVEWHFSW
jgi:hypothetical protein